MKIGKNVVLENDKAFIDVNGELISVDAVIQAVRVGSDEFDDVFESGLINRDEFVWAGMAVDDEMECYAFEPVDDHVVLYNSRNDRRFQKFCFVFSKWMEDGTGVYDGERAMVVFHDAEADVCDYLARHLRSGEYAMSPRAQQIHAGGAKHKLLDKKYVKAKEMGGIVPTIFRTQRVLKPHQEKAVVIGSVAEAILNADQVGLGKGGEFISTLLAKVELGIKSGTHREECYPFVIVVTSSMKSEIAKEITLWDEDAKVEILSGRSAAPIKPDTEFIVVNVNILHDWKQSIIDACPKGLVVDEAQAVNNPQAKCSKAALDIANAVRDNSYDPIVILATATPFQNGAYELWGLMKILGVADSYGELAEQLLEIDGEEMFVEIAQGRAWTPGSKPTRKVYLQGQLAFEARWCDGHSDNYGHWQKRGASNTAELFQIMSEDFLIRRLKSDVLHPLPPLHQQEVYVDLASEDERVYRRKEREFRDYMFRKVEREARREGSDVEYNLRVLTKKLDNAEAVMRVSELRKTLGYMKTTPAIEWIQRFFDTDEITGGDPNRNKLIVFVHHKESQARLVNSPVLKRYGLVNITDSNTSMKGIQKAKEKFQKDPKTRLMICNSGAVAGHTLTAAYDTLMVELLYGPVATMQAAGRNWARFSEEFEPHEAYFHLMIAKDTIDYATFHSNLVKKSLMNGFIDGDVIDEDLIRGRYESLDERMDIARAILENSGEGELDIAH